ncbi:hypothetical protein TOT_030000626 [Theileria orientalis strain Shintoku]|uniref:Uncharacterized protein n=1 Tax=Theileria orientalis strain Shintoku TaxID=869250 RepID=J4DPV5_THEOR|nr:hypothetical protein TOT_030000626 [Theileria orientalis strain Shintoku]BAM41364.1 hypothetical protein TOT_030000626 [Theileria orientalis strain Shintoku]|eukprot:XP_009691665.1 hypothetical protein TOT_030000626 [Theileria orientalis strain Shintoku]
MGAGQSYLYINLNNKNQKCTVNGCTVTPSTALFNDTIDFEVVTYNFNYNGKAPTSFDIYIYDSKEAVYDSSYIFGYCSPSSNQVANNVEVYYSVLAQDKPLVITFVTNNQKYNCKYDDLKYARWNWASYITEHTFTGDLLPKLKEQYRKLLLNKTIKFAVGDEATNGVEVIHQEIGDEKKKYRIIYTPKNRDSVLNCNCLFNLDKETKDLSNQLEVKDGCKGPQDKKAINKIDQYCLTSVKAHFFDGIIVYYEKENDNKYTALYLEFIDLRKKDICLKRIDQEGCWWAEETINYKDKTSLGSQLGTIKNGLKKVNTVILDVKVSYTGVEVNPDKTTQAYIKYTHTFTSEDEHNFLYGRKIITIGSCLTNVKSKKVEVYYLKAKNKEDEQPFLIEFIPNGEGAQNNKNAYHFTYNEGFDKWTECKESNKLKNKLDKINTNGGCITKISLLRWYAHEILIGEEPKVPKTEDETIPKKPDIVEPKPEPEPPPIWLIVGCVAAGVVLIVTLVVVYGIYWYNTTIKLLT